MCNREVKFDRLWERARAIEADFIATGHYARILHEAEGSYRLLRAADSSKDQSYFLFGLNQDQLARTLFPLGSMTKREVRERARELGLANADKPESQEICFVPDGDYAAYVERAARALPADAIRPGRITDGNGETLAGHTGIHRFTIGQRRGLGLASSQPLYVRSINPATGDITVGPRSGLTAAGLIASQVSLVAPAGADRDFDAEVKIRYRHPVIRARVRLHDESRAEVRFENGGPAITPGQACVFYRGDEVLGGGFIERALEA
jgi:tRNA-specific 2-thiouridylase